MNDELMDDPVLVLQQIRVQPSDVAFDESPDAGDPRCICSRCQRHLEVGPQGDCPTVVRVWNGEEGEAALEWRYCALCAAAPQGEPLLAFPPYREDGPVPGIPGHWTARELQLLVSFLAWFIQAPCWNVPFEHADAPPADPLIDLRRRVVGLVLAGRATGDTVREISAWLDDALEIGLDPL
ncbi:MAG: hypothetical protein AB1705_15415 [Verrucomicrobiota bacterium]